MFSENFIRDRIAVLRVQKGVSEYKMSLDLGHSKSYIQSISSGKALPSMTEFFYICNYFNITPYEFFDDNLQCPEKVSELINTTSDMSTDDLQLLIDVAKKIKS